MIKQSIGATLAVCMVAASPAAAQVAGTYSGMAADGSPVNFTVGTDPQTGALAVTGAGINFSAPCKGTSTTLQSGFGYGMMADISNRAVSNTTYYFNLYIIFTLKFAKDGQTATGTESVDAPSFDLSSEPPVKTLFCQSKKQTLSVSLQTATAARAAVPVQNVYDRRGNIIGQITR